jgi:uncharacterized protein YndB with AHSA1/START domain
MNDMTEQRIKPATIHKVVEIKAPAERAFRVFTRQMGQWWNKQFSINQGVPQRDVVMEPMAGGRWFEIGVDGSECPWGRVVDWDEPNRVCLAWQINADWNYDPEFETRVDVRFEERDGVTIVTLTHSDLERFGDAMTRQIEQMDGGWGKLLDGFKRKVETH